jgi:hypothetical protein
MNDLSKTTGSKLCRIAVAGDVCVDVVGVAVPPPASGNGSTDNWRLTGERQTHYRLGGALLLADFVKASSPHASVQGSRPCRPKSLSGDQLAETILSPDDFLALAERLTRAEVVHSLLELDRFRPKPDAKKAETLRVLRTHGFSGPKTGDPSLKLLPPDDSAGPPDVIVLDDTGNRFRRSPDQWPAAISQPSPESQPIIVHKLHRSLPTKDAVNNSPLWQTLTGHPSKHRIVVLSIDDLRDCGAPISSGLSWERTALDLVWQLLNVEDFASLRQTPHLIVRLGLDGVIYWHARKGGKADDYSAWLVYDPAGIEGTAESSCDGRMVGYGSVFTAALVQHLAAADGKGLLEPLKDREGNITAPATPIVDGIKSGLIASRRLLQLGFGTKLENPQYPGADLFLPDPENDLFFGCQRVPIIPAATEPDRGYWRLLDSIFYNKDALLHRAVALVATEGKAADTDDKLAAALLREAPIAVFAKALRTYDRREIENYRALYSLLSDYMRQTTPPRPLSVAVFGPPGAGKSFGVKHVAKALTELGTARPIETITFNLSQYKNPDELSDAFHLVRDFVLRGKIPLVFFDEFDTSIDGKLLGWLRYFLSPMQDGEFMDRGTPHPIGQAIFVFAGGTCGTYEEFAEPSKIQESNNDSDEVKKAIRHRQQEFKNAKGTDFLSRLRGVLNIPDLDLDAAFDSYGPVEAFPCEAAILLRRAGILAYQLREKAPSLLDSNKALRVRPSVLRALLHLPRFEHGNRSFEALLDMSNLQGVDTFTPSLLPARGYTDLHADATHLSQLLATDYPFPPNEREKIAQAIHRKYVEQRKNDPDHKPDEAALKDWRDLASEFKQSNLEQADHIAVKLRVAGLWFRKAIPGVASAPNPKELELMLETLAESEHDRWVAEKRRQGWIPAPDKSRESRNNLLRLHNCLFRWNELDRTTQDLDREPIRSIPLLLAEATYEIIKV